VFEMRVRAVKMETYLKMGLEKLLVRIE